MFDERAQLKDALCESTGVQVAPFTQHFARRRDAAPWTRISYIYIYNLTLHDQRFSFEPTAVGHGIVRPAKRAKNAQSKLGEATYCLLYTSPSPRD